MSAVKDMDGILPPTGFFDPLQLSLGKSEAELKKWREAELKHGRLSMLATVGIIVAEKFHPFFNGLITGPGIYHFQQADLLLPNFWLFVLFNIGLVEAYNINIGWESPNESSGGIANLKVEYINGDLGYDPLNLKPKSKEGFRKMRNKELQNGRLAMIGITGIVIQELVTGKGIF